MFKSPRYHLFGVLILIYSIELAKILGNQNPFEFLIPFDFSFLARFFLFFFILLMFLHLIGKLVATKKKGKYTLFDIWLIASFFK